MKITASFVKFNEAILAPILTKIFNGVMRTAIIPSEWKHSYITPIPKKGAINDIANYLGIAMQSVISKNFDKLITKLLYPHLESIIRVEQHGFTTHKSTISNLLQVPFLHREIS